MDVEHTSLGTLTLPGPPLRFFDADGAEVTRREHRAPPVLDEHAARIRAWLDAAARPGAPGLDAAGPSASAPGPEAGA